MNLYKPFNDTFIGLWNKVHTDCNPSWLAQLQSQLSEALPTYLESTETQAVDLRITQHWLRTMVWQLCVSHGFVSSMATDNAMKFEYPIEISRDLLSTTRQFSQQAMEVHGVGLVSPPVLPNPNIPSTPYSHLRLSLNDRPTSPSHFRIINLFDFSHTPLYLTDTRQIEKLFDIACCLTDVIACIPFSPLTFSLGPQDYLSRFLTHLSTLRSGQTRYLPLLLSKISDVLPNPSLPPSLQQQQQQQQEQLQQQRQLQQHPTSALLTTPSVSPSPGPDPTLLRLPSRPQPSFSSSSSSPSFSSSSSSSSSSAAAAAAAAAAPSLLPPSSRIDDLALYADAVPYADSVHSSAPSSDEATPGPGSFETDLAAAAAAHHHYHHHHHHGLGYGLQSAMGYAYGVGVGVGVGVGFAGQEAQVQVQASGQGMYERAMEAQRRAQGEMEMDPPLAPSLFTASRSRTRPRRTAAGSMSGALVHSQSGIEVATWGSITPGNWKSRGNDLQREGMEGKKHLAAS